eukprot:6204367-Pleurochrysis_carterae.AAC.1
MLGWPNETENDKWGTTAWAAVKCSRKVDVGRGSSSVAQAFATHKTQARTILAAQRRRLDTVDVGLNGDGTPAMTWLGGSRHEAGQVLGVVSAGAADAGSVGGWVAGES